MLRNLNQSNSGRRILGVHTSGILASTIVAQTATGDNGPGLLYDDASLVGNAGKELRCVVVTPPSSGSLFVYENGSFELTGAVDGAYSVGYSLFVDGVQTLSDVASITVGTVSGTAGAGTGTGVSSGSGGSAVGGISAAPAVFIGITTDAPVFSGSAYVPGVVSFSTQVTTAPPAFIGSAYSEGAPPHVLISGITDSPVFVGSVASSPLVSFMNTTDSPVFNGRIDVMPYHVSAFLKYVVKEARTSS